MRTRVPPGRCSRRDDKVHEERNLLYLIYVHAGPSSETGESCKPVSPANFSQLCSQVLVWREGPVPPVKPITLLLVLLQLRVAPACVSNSYRASALLLLLLG